MSVSASVIFTMSIRVSGLLAPALVDRGLALRTSASRATLRRRPRSSASSFSDQSLTLAAVDVIVRATEDLHVALREAVP
jgi:hypothetical protein